MCDWHHDYGDCYGTGYRLCTWCSASMMCDGCDGCEEEEECEP